MLVLDEIQSISLDDDAPLAILLNEARRTKVKLSLACPSIFSSSKKNGNVLLQCGTRLFFQSLAHERATLAEMIDSKKAGTINYLLASLPRGVCVSKGDFVVGNRIVNNVLTINVVHPEPVDDSVSKVSYCESNIPLEE